MSLYLPFLLLALVQALTEFLPVSSSGHLVLVQHWLGLTADTDFIYDILLHLATVGSILVFFRKDVLSLIRGFVYGKIGGDSIFAGHERKAVLLILLTLIPTGILGLSVKKFGLDYVLNPRVVGVLLMATGALLWFSRKRDPDGGIELMGIREALLVGLFQGVAVLPGISRSGATIACLLLLGFRRDLAARFSLLMSVPAILGVNLLEVISAYKDDLPLPPAGPTAAGMITAAVAGYFAIGWILRLLEQRRFYLFAYYLWPLGLIAFLAG